MSTHNNTSDPIVLSRIELPAELRVITLQESSTGDLTIIEKTDGELTHLTFGSISHTSRVTIPSSQLEPLAHVIGYGEERPSQALQLFFSRQNVYLSDLQDKMDSAGISYGFSTSSGNVTSTRTTSTTHD